MDSFPSLSIIIPSWNQGRFIKRTLLSILRQDYPGSVQIIVSDGGSTDETVSVLKEFGESVIWWSQKDKGFVDAVMKGATVATGEILAIQSSDDYYLPGAFRAMAMAFAENPAAGFVCGAECSIDLEGNIISYSAPSGTITPESILYKSTPPQHGTFLRRNLFEKVKGLRVEVDMCADIDLWYRVSHLQPGIYMNQFVAVYQLHPDQRTVLSDKWHPSLIKMVETCESNPAYNTIFRLSDVQKKDLFSYWEMDWTARRDFQEGKKVAWKKIWSIWTQGKRTNRVMVGLLFPRIIIEQLKKILGKNKPDPKILELTHTLPLKWWEQFSA